MRLKILIVCMIWLLWLMLYLVLRNPEFDENLVEYKSGYVENSRCIRSRSINGMKILVDYGGSGGAAEDYIRLPGKYDCDEDLLSEFIGEEIHISQYGNRYIAVSIGAHVLKTESEGVEEILDNTLPGFFLFFFALVISFIVLIRKGFDHKAICQSKK